MSPTRLHPFTDEILLDSSQRSTHELHEHHFPRSGVPHVFQKQPCVAAFHVFFFMAQKANGTRLYAVVVVSQ